ncbi:uncharacterized protein AFUA_2G09690 [Aspergillus fumigatus Af293]|uniref:Uncharacterized protein n=2 Tax=Aspergillus fumigatus TaxID=746128 RepID=Q4X1K1_ASPFU|nr:hypothetical protein AFUA_2G09690 [Aspergillus fumigatus Af293]EAL93264.1 hypothetical protein AFUA_2G09690 [Aspergillus fumigatus Af293]EDP54497.1 hypothetical protein AFUB_025540 [Aspergillus fumigatus A1163]
MIMLLDAGRLRLFRSIKSSIELHPSSPSLPWQLSTPIHDGNYSPLYREFPVSQSLCSSPM